MFRFSIILLGLTTLLFLPFLPGSHQVIARGSIAKMPTDHLADADHDAEYTSSFFLAVNEADLRDVLSLLAINMEKTIILLDDPFRVTFFMENITPSKAMALLLQKEGLDYFEDDDCILVGRPERLKEKHFSLMTLTRFDLFHISAADLSRLVGELGIALKVLSLDTNPRTVWIQGTPQELGKVREIITALDRPENADPENTSPLKRIDLQYLNAEAIRPMIEQLALPAKVITMPVNPQTLWVQGTSSAIDRLLEMIAVLDLPENAGHVAKLDMERFKLNYVDADKMILLLKEAGIAEGYIIPGETAQLLWIYGPPGNLEIARKLIAAADLPENSEQLPYLFIYQFNNISASDAAERIEEMDIFNGVKVLSFNYPEICRELLIICPLHLKEQVYTALDLLDEARRRIRIPVDSAAKRATLAAKRELLAELTGISASRMHISDNLSGDSENPYYVLWVEETPGKVQQVRDMVEIIDAPRTGR